MNLKKHAPLLVAVGGIVVGFTLIRFNADHRNDITSLTLLLAGAAICASSPAIALAWMMHRKGRFRVRWSGIACALLMVIGMMGPSRVDALVPYNFGDIFGLFFWSGFLGLVIPMLVRWMHQRRQNNRVHPSTRASGLEVGNL